MNINTIWEELLERYNIAVGDDRQVVIGNRRNTVRVMMSPDDFLRHAMEESGRSWDAIGYKADKVFGPNYPSSGFLKGRYGYTFNKIKREMPMDVPYLKFRVDTGEVVGHEGRHRAYAAKKLGIKEIPVDIYCREKDPNSPYKCDSQEVYGVEKHLGKIKKKFGDLKIVTDIDKEKERKWE